jgi:hypothetical protein
MRNVIFTLLSLICGAGMLACDSHGKSDDYYISAARFKLSRFSDYLHELKAFNGKIPEVTPFSSDYPINSTIMINREPNYLIGDDYRFPFNIADNSNAIEVHGMRFADFMYDAYFSVNRAGPALIQYISNGSWFMIISCGPDQIYERDWLSTVNDVKATISTPASIPGLWEHLYDPTNGTISRGDVIVTSETSRDNVDRQQYN